MARHLKPGGWLILEPWVEPDEWKPELVDANESFDETSKVKILQARQASTDGSVSILQIDYHIETPAETLDFSETHRLGLFTREKIESALKKAAFESRYLPQGSADQSIVYRLLHALAYSAFEPNPSAIRSAISPSNCSERVRKAIDAPRASTAFIILMLIRCRMSMWASQAVVLVK